MTPEIAFLQSWNEFPALRPQVSPKLSPPAKLRSFADLNCKSWILYKGQSCNCNFDPYVILRYYRLYLAKPFILEVATKVATLLPAPGRGAHRGGDRRLCVLIRPFLV